MEISEGMIEKLDINKKELEFILSKAPEKPVSPIRHLIALLIIGGVLFWSAKRENGFGDNTLLYLIVLIYYITEYFRTRRIYRMYSLALDIITFYRDQKEISKAP